MVDERLEGEEDIPVVPPDVFDKCDWQLERDFHSMKEIGKGKDTVIYSAICLPLNKTLVAVKVYNKQRLASTKVRAIKREVAMMTFFQRQRVPNVVEFYAAFQDPMHYYIVMEYCEGGDLLERLLKEKKPIHERKLAVHVAIPALTTLKRLHSAGIIHRDIKLENIFIDAAGHVKIGDFGLTMCTHQEAAISPVGTVEYMAPEVVALPPVDAVLNGQVRASDIPPNSEKVDIWALGVTLFELATGRLPFEGREKAQIKTNITEYRMASFGHHVSVQCQDFIRQMLAYDPSHRSSAEELLQHSFLAQYKTKVLRPSPGPSFRLQAFTPGTTEIVGSDGSQRSNDDSQPDTKRSTEATPLTLEKPNGGARSAGLGQITQLMRFAPRACASVGRSLKSISPSHGAGSQDDRARPLDGDLCLVGSSMAWDTSRQPAVSRKPESEGSTRIKPSSTVKEMKMAVKRMFSLKSVGSHGGTSPLLQ